MTKHLDDPETATCDNNVLFDIFEKKYIIAGTILFEPYLSEILKWSFSKMVYSESELTDELISIDKKGLDYIILPDFKRLFYSKDYGVQIKINEARIMCDNIGWGLDF